MPSTNDDKISMTMTVHSQDQANELSAAWREIVGQEKLTRLNLREEDIQAIMDRAQDALLVIESAINQNPTTGQARRLVSFVAGLYNGRDYPFDLTDLRAIDTRLANACLDYLNYDRLGIAEIHKHLTNGDRDLHRWLHEYGIDASRSK
jgi:hypothetical protein